MIKVFLEKSAWKDSLSVYIFDYDEISGKRYLIQFGKHHTSLKEVQPYSGNIEPSFRLDGHSSQGFLKAMCEAAADWGIKLESDLKREGKLEAVEKHLKDMRQLVFKKEENGPRPQQEP